MRSEASRRALVERLERECVEAPARYRLKLAMLAALGYVVLFGALVLTWGVLLAMLGYALFARPVFEPLQAIVAIVLAMTGAVVARSLWIVFVEPEGHRLQADEAPELQAEIERVRTAAGAPPLHGIVINAEPNASAAFMPDGLVLGGQRHYLVLGLPLLQALDRRELAAVIAHEFGHFVGGHERFTGWIYGLRLRWHRLLEGLSKHGYTGGMLLLRFFRWYSPYFEAYSQALARRREFLADATGARICGASDVASALVRNGRIHHWLERTYWPSVHQLARDQSYPPIEVHQRMAERMALEVNDTDALPARLLGGQADLHDTHPTLRMRLAALGYDAPPAPEPARQAARTPAATMLGELGDTLRQRFSLEWRSENQDMWKALHARWGQERILLEGLESRARLGPDEQVQLACLTEDHRPNAAVMALFEEAVRASPSSAIAHHRIGLRLLRDGDLDGGLARLEHALALDAGLAIPALDAMEDAFVGLDAASPLHAQLASLRARHEGIDSMDADVAQEHEWLPHALDAVALRELARALRGFEKVRAAWVVRQPLSGERVLSHYVVVLEWAGSVASENATLPRVHKQLTLPGSCSLATTTSDPARARSVKRSAGEPAYQRS